MKTEPEISVIIPCLDEEKSIGRCIEEVENTIKNNSLSAEIIVIDNDSTDNTANVVLEYQKRYQNINLISEKRRGYGSAYLAGFKVARGEYFFLADADFTYDFGAIPDFIRKLKEGFDLVVGNRFSGKMEEGSMPHSHKYIGNPVLSFLTRLFFGIKLRDIHCGARAISKKVLEKITIYTIGMEFATEMIMKAKRGGLKMTEVPIAYRVRVGESKLKTWNDGWRHLRFMLLYSPMFLFFIPGVIIFTIGLLLLAWFNFFHPQILGINLYYHPMFIASLLTIVGYQLIIFALFSKIYAITHLGDDARIMNRIFRHITLERGLLFGLIVMIIGLYIYSSILIGWVENGFGALDQIKNSISALTLLIIGIQTLSSSFMMSVLGIKEK